MLLDSNVLIARLNDEQTEERPYAEQALTQRPTVTSEVMVEVLHKMEQFERMRRKHLYKSTFGQAEQKVYRQTLAGEVYDMLMDGIIRVTDEAILRGLYHMRVSGLDFVDCLLLAASTSEQVATSDKKLIAAMGSRWEPSAAAGAFL